MNGDKNIPSSGSIVKVKFKMSSGSGKYVFIVSGKDNSPRSSIQSESAYAPDQEIDFISQNSSRVCEDGMPIHLQVEPLRSSEDDCRATDLSALVAERQ